MRRRDLSFIGGGLLAAVLAAVLLLAWPEDPSQTNVLGPQSAVSEDDVLSIRAWVQTNRVYAGRPMRLLLTFVNRSGTAAAVRITDLQTPGFGSHVLFHSANGAFVVFPIAVPPHASVAIESELAPGDQSFGRFQIAASYLWTRANESRTGLVSVGPIEITDLFHARAALIATRFYSAVKDLALPIIIAAFGLALQLSQKNREMRQAIWTTQLPRLHEYAERHYMPIVRSLRFVLKDYKSVRPRPSRPTARSEETNRYSWELFVFLRQMRALREDRGGVFFRNRSGERVFQDAWYAFNHNVTRAIGEDTYERVLKNYAVTTTFDDFNAALAAASATSAAHLAAAASAAAVTSPAPPSPIAAPRPPVSPAIPATGPAVPATPTSPPTATRPASPLDSGAPPAIVTPSTAPLSTAPPMTTTAAPSAPDALMDMCLKTVEWLNGGAGSVGRYENCLDLLQILKNVCSFEANRPFDEYWYESPDDFDVKPPEQCVFPAQPAEDIARLKRELAEYYESTKKYLRRNQRL